MSQMKTLYEKVAVDLKLREKFNGILQEAEKVGAEETQNQLLSFAKEEGYDITIDEMQRYFEGLAKQEGELSDQELDMVAGGKSTAETVLSYATLNIACNILNSMRDSQVGKECTSLGSGSRY